MNLESYMQGLSGVTNILRPYRASSKCLWTEQGRIGVEITVMNKSNTDTSKWTMRPKYYRNEDAFISAMWTFAEKIWEQLNENKKGTQHG